MTNEIKELINLIDQNDYDKIKIFLKKLKFYLEALLE